MEVHQRIMESTPRSIKRYLDADIHWQAQAICVLGGRGVGKTTLLCQHILERYQGVNECLYISADYVPVIAQGLLAIAKAYFKYGGKALVVDEVHKYPGWEQEVKNIIDIFKDKQIIISGSSALDLKLSKYDLSRRVVYYHLHGLSFREYLGFKSINVPVVSLETVLENPMQCLESFQGVQPLQHFDQYLRTGYFPFFMEGEQDYLHKINNIIEKVIAEDIATTYGLKQETLVVLKKLLWLVASSKVMTPNIDKISKNLGASRQVIYDGLDYLHRAGLINAIYPKATGMKLVRKPHKVLLENTNVLQALTQTLGIDREFGGIRETFFVNQVACKHHVQLAEKADFMVDNHYAIEVGGPAKKSTQIQGVSNAYIASDMTTVSVGKKIPLFLFGCLY